ncbi:MFS transporter [Tumebacillus permanentifrigoris]|uniref:Putative MFS family arabinose efflux permease n=1 Tax=Tumebacillus permanentifrigoris TaxID=378543 RepID=A0A316DBA3_9BACL|nr:MFS transporter [Tumebacillus permanentifrigoris]PWK14372.1 putative MFS family arabinose efflux permease [Tumebacillus permanentifrigoris]
MRTYPKILWLLAAGCFLNIGGLSFLWPLNSIYIHEHMGRPLTVAGLVLLLHSAGASIGQLTGGMLYDRFGARPVLLTGLICSASLIAIPGFVENWPLYVTVMFLFGFTASLVSPAMFALAAKVWPEGGRRAFNFLYVANNLGVAAGTAIGGIVAAHSFHLAFLSAAGTMVVFLCFVFVFIRDPKPIREREVPQALAEQAATSELDTVNATDSSTREPAIPWLPIASLFTGCVVLWIIYVQWQSSIAVTMQENYSLAEYSRLWTLNGLVIFLGQPLIAAIARWCKSLSSQLFLGVALFFLCYVLLLTNHDRYAVFVAGMVLLTLGEMLLWPVIPAAVAQLSPPSRIGFLQGFIGSGATVGRMLGPLCGGLLFDYTSFQVLLATMTALLTVPVLCFLVYTRTRTRTTT